MFLLQTVESDQGGRVDHNTPTWAKDEVPAILRKMPLLPDRLRMLEWSILDMSEAGQI